MLSYLLAHSRQWRTRANESCNCELENLSRGSNFSQVRHLIRTACFCAALWLWWPGLSAIRRALDTDFSVGHAVGIHFHAASGKHVRSREELLQGQAKSVTSWGDREKIFIPARPLTQSRQTLLRTITDPHLVSLTATFRRHIFMVVVHALQRRGKTCTQASLFAERCQMKFLCAFPLPL